MQTTKKQAAKNVEYRMEVAVGRPPALARGRRANSRFLAVLVALGILTACSPPGPRAVLEGKKLLDRGDYVRAIEELRTGTQLLPTNAVAFSYLGLAFQEAGQSAEAERAYVRALALNHDLTEIHYNLGCLWLSQSNKLDQAKAELTTYTLRRPNSGPGWLRLGEAQLRARELTAAEKSLNEALKFEPQDPEVLTTIGLARYQRRRANEAAQYFSKALKQQPDYGPALLNLAIVAQQELNDPQLALRNYQQYVSLKPAPENLQAVSAIVRQLEEELNPPPRGPATNLTALIHTNTPKMPVPELAHGQLVPKPPATNTNSANHTPVVSKTVLATNVAKNTGANNVQKPAPNSNSAPAETIEVVKLDSEPVIKPA